MLLAGHTAEKLEFGEVTTGASNDLQRATDLARSLITQFGMSDNLAPRTYGDKDEMIFLGREISEKRNYSEKVAEEIDGEIDKLVLQAAVTAKKVISENKDKMDKIVKELLEKEKIEKDDFLFLVDGIKPPSPKDTKEKKDKEVKEVNASDASEEKKEIKKDKEND